MFLFIRKREVDRQATGLMGKHLSKHLSEIQFNSSNSVNIYYDIFNTHRHTHRQYVLKTNLYTLVLYIYMFYDAYILMKGC